MVQIAKVKVGAKGKENNKKELHHYLLTMLGYSSQRIYANQSKKKEVTDVLLSRCFSYHWLTLETRRANLADMIFEI